MSLIGSKLAVVSLGVSCQVAHQINSHADLLRDISGDRTLEERNLVFDWLICPPSGAASMLRAGRFAPPSYEDLELRAERHRWAPHNVYYWHDFKRFDPSRLAQAYPAVREKYERRAERMLALRDRERIVCVVANTQPNLEAIRDEVGTVSPGLDAIGIADLRAAASSFWGRPVEFLLLLAEHRVTPGFAPEGAACYTAPVRPTLGWRGDPAPWTAAFADYFATAQPSR